MIEFGQSDLLQKKNLSIVVYYYNSYNHIGDSGAERLGYVLQHNRTLEGLQLWKNCISNEGAEGLAAGLVINSHIKWLGVKKQTHKHSVLVLQIYIMHKT